MLSRRLNRLEQAGAGLVPLWLQQWLGLPLSDEDQARASAEWTEVQRQPGPDLASYPADVREWLVRSN
jgi:hypothetical protein